MGSSSSSLSESSDIILNIEIPDFVMNDEEDPQPDGDSSCANMSNPCQTSTSCPPGTSTTAPPPALPLSQPSSSTTPATSSSHPCPSVPPSLGHPASSSLSIPPPSENTAPLCQAGFHTCAFRKPESPKSVAPVPGGAMQWYYTSGPCLLTTPPSRVSDLEVLEHGDLFLHEDTRSAQFQVWMWDGAGWGQTEEGVPHPVLGDKRRLWFRFVKEEGRYELNWIVRGS
ncbi:hypothetical protein GSI_14886 [Ganoderma sinense ZZ0214-1]|uniref:Uncharacterized protein n=1 Tax=Ganoderma sinense ZZ0214-1 TaxID=1077348 RepID=A0A2G8RPZ5_9APHY|nr:hypothetical protein GSI_14886 [Ganoderma sinense ZZ0214-1]